MKEDIETRFYFIDLKFKEIEKSIEKLQTEKASKNIISRGEAIPLIYRSLPYNNMFKVADDNNTHESCIYFEWRGSKYKFNLRTMEVDFVQGEFLIGNDCAILIEHLIKLNYETKTT